MRLTMRGPIVGIAFLLGPCFVIALGGSLSACQITPTETADAGSDVYIPPQACDTIGYTCSQCQTCAAVQTTCYTQIQACEASDICLGLAMCNDACDINAPENTDCKTECCNEAADPNGIEVYMAVARCIYDVGCPQTCNLQAALDMCPGF
jgi:hypothetical protein